MQNQFFSNKSISLIAASLLVGTSALADRTWSKDDSPGNIDHSYIHEFSKLPLEGGLVPESKRGWADSYWPKVNGSIAERWQVKGSYYKTDRSPSPTDISTMGEAEINLLSPAEKFDLARGNLNFPIASEIRKKFKEEEKDWRGSCNGWTHASLNIDEPKPIVYKNNKTGVTIPFGSSDIKGLLAYYYAWKESNSTAHFIGKTCRPYSKLFFNFNGACDDVNPGSFHIMMANEMGLKHQGFAADRDLSVQVWNHPFVKYTSKIDKINSGELSKNASKSARYEYYITSTLTYVNELYNTDNEDLEDSDHAAPSYLPVLATQKNKTVEYKYVLELNSRGNIIGGEWISEAHPDLIWKQKYKLPGMVIEEEKRDDWSLLSELVRIATEGV